MFRLRTYINAMNEYFRAVGVSPISEREPVPRHAAHGGGAGRGRRAPARPVAVPPARRASRARQALARPV